MYININEYLRIYVYNILKYLNKGENFKFEMYFQLGSSREMFSI